MANSHRRTSGRQKNVAKARELQRLYRTNTNVCIRKILDDTPPSCCAIPEADHVAHYTSTYAAAEPVAATPPWLYSRTSQDDILEAPFTPSEIQHQLRRAKKTAPDADILTYSNWKWADPEGAILSTIFNICCAAGKIPAEWKRSAVTLLPKGRDGSIVRNWRPICLQNTICKCHPTNTKVISPTIPSTISQVASFKSRSRPNTPSGPSSTPYQPSPRLDIKVPNPLHRSPRAALRNGAHRQAPQRPLPRSWAHRALVFDLPQWKRTLPSPPQNTPPSNILLPLTPHSGYVADGRPGNQATKDHHLSHHQQRL